MRRRMQGVGQGLDVLEPERRLHRPVVEDLQGGDFVLVLGDEGFECLHQAPGALGGGGVEAGFEQRVLGDDIDDLVGLAPQVQQQIAQGRIGERSNCFLDSGFRRNDGCGVGAQGFDDAAGDALEIKAAAGFDNPCLVGVADVALQARQPRGH
jgi:hypothetical protein